MEDGAAFAVGYRIEVDDEWRTRRAERRAWWPGGAGQALIEGDGGASSVDGVDRPDLAGCLDVGLGVLGLHERLPAAPRWCCRRDRVVEPGCRFGAAFDLVYDRSGLVLTYPGLAVRADGETTDRALPDSM